MSTENESRPPSYSSIYPFYSKEMSSVKSIASHNIVHDVVNAQQLIHNNQSMRNQSSNNTIGNNMLSLPSRNCSVTRNQNENSTNTSNHNQQLFQYDSPGPINYEDLFSSCDLDHSVCSTNQANLSNRFLLSINPIMNNTSNQNDDNDSSDNISANENNIHHHVPSLNNAHHYRLNDSIFSAPIFQQQQQQQQQQQCLQRRCTRNNINFLRKKLQSTFSKSYYFRHLIFILMMSLALMLFQLALSLSDDVKSLNRFYSGVWIGLIMLLTLLLSWITICKAKLWLVIVTSLVHLITVSFGLGSFLIINSILLVEHKRLNYSTTVCNHNCDRAYIYMAMLILGGVSMVMLTIFFFKLVSIFNINNRLARIHN